MRETQQDTVRRLHVLRGQLDAVIRRAEDEFDPLDALAGIKTVRRALKSLHSMLVEACLRTPGKAKRALKLIRD